ncbi:hypothetical protein [Christiangramia sp.]|uniref:hypothetical protein n=1 Tax=Christiangramia sp. TaxID=1931228 RepID=UPI002620FAC1|nr:hypothetical protein [Christiangramia sp.]
MEEALQKIADVLQIVVEKQQEMEKQITELNGNKKEPDNQPTEAEKKAFAWSSKS